ncbi:MAG TPA: hypothetical protein VMJ72_01845 [Candidatus Paceibacterota bacterium]|nr:hypothetical protein [Candidatus Paceibacterota bacterium]
MKIRTVLAPFVVVGILACGGGKGSPTSPTPTPSSPSSFAKTLTVIGIPSQKTYGTVAQTVPAAGKVFDDAFFASVGVAPAPQYAVCTEAPRGGFIGTIAGAKRNGTLNCRFTEDGPGVIYIAENDDLVKCGMEQNGMGHPVLDGAIVGGGMQLTARKITQGEALGTYYGAPLVGADSPDSDQYPVQWFTKINGLFQVQGAAIIRFDYNKTSSSADVAAGFYTYDGTDGMHLQGKWFAVNVYDLQHFPAVSVTTNALSESGEMVSSGQNNPTCPPGDYLHGATVVWGQGDYSDVGRNILPWGVLYGLAEKAGK